MNTAKVITLLKVCPFCGSDAKQKSGIGVVAIECTRRDCGALLFANKARAAVAAWNRRTKAGAA